MSDSMTRRQRLHTKESKVAAEAENFGVSENMDMGGGMRSIIADLMGVCDGGSLVVVQAERKISDSSSFGNDWMGVARRQTTSRRR